MIRVQNLIKKFGDLTAVDNISFDVRKGEIFAFLGPNGAGKTTTIKMLTTLMQPTSGTVELNALNPVVEREARKCCGIVFQDPSLDQDLTAWANMGVPWSALPPAPQGASRADRDASKALLIAEFGPASLRGMPLGLLFILLIAFVFVALGVSVGSSLQDMQGFQLIMRFLVMPIFFFSGALFPLDHLPRGLAALTTIDPLSYGVDGLRATLIGAMHFGVLLDLAVLAPISIVLIYPDGGLAHSAVVDALDSTAVDEYDGIARQTQNTRKLSPAASFKRLGIGSKFSKEEGP